MAEKPAKGRAGSPLPTATPQNQDGAHGVTRPTQADHAVIIPLTVKDILEEQLARKLA